MRNSHMVSDTIWNLIDTITKTNLSIIHYFRFPAVETSQNDGGSNGDNNPMVEKREQPDHELRRGHHYQRPLTLGRTRAWSSLAHNFA